MPKEIIKLITLDYRNGKIFIKIFDDNSYGWNFVLEKDIWGDNCDPLLDVLNDDKILKIVKKKVDNILKK